MKEHKTRIGVIFGGRSGEHEVSLMSARSVLSALDVNKYEVVQIGITHKGDWVVGENVLEAMLENDTEDLMSATLLPDPTRNIPYRIRQTSTFGESLERLTPLDVIFPVLHGTFGEDGTLQGLLEMADVPYIGAGVLGSALGMDKGVFKDVMRAHNIPVVDSIIMLRKEIASDMTSVLARAEHIPYPVFVKPANLGSSVGITKCRNRSDLMEGLMEAARFDRRVLIERGVNAREIEVSVLGNDTPEASVPGEVVPSREFYTYEAKYLDENSQLLIPAPISTEMADKVRQLAVEAYKAIDCSGMARADFLLDKGTGELFLGEINTIPGFTKISMYPKLWEASGLPYSNLLDRLVQLALERKGEKDQTERKYNVQS